MRRAGVTPRGRPGGADGDAAFDAKYVVKGDADFARKLLSPEQRERLLRLQEAGGYVWVISGGLVELGGPLPTDSAGLKRFLEQCDSVLEGWRERSRHEADCRVLALLAFSLLRKGQSPRNGLPPIQEPCS